MSQGYLVLETGETYSGEWLGGAVKAGEVVFNTSHCGYEEIATDPSYHSQIMVMTSAMQGNYGSHSEDWESKKLHINGFICLEMQNTSGDSAWKDRLVGAGIPVMDSVDTRKLVLRLRDLGTVWGACVNADSADQAKELAKAEIERQKKEDRDWAWTVSRREKEIFKGQIENGPRVALLDFGTKQNIISELTLRCSEVSVFPGRVSAKEVQEWEPDGVFLSNGPGDPKDVLHSVETIKNLLGWRPMYGVCMGHQLLSLALGAETFKLRFGHRGGNHPVRDAILDEIYMTSQNHGYAVKEDTLPSGVSISHVNLYDQTVEGIECIEKKCRSVQFHPESRPGPRDSEGLFDFFVEGLR